MSCGWGLYYFAGMDMTRAWWLCLRIYQPASSNLGLRITSLGISKGALLSRQHSAVLAQFQATQRDLQQVPTTQANRLCGSVDSGPVAHNPEPESKEQSPSGHFSGARERPVHPEGDRGLMYSRQSLTGFFTPFRNLVRKMSSNSAHQTERPE